MVSCVCRMSVLFLLSLGVFIKSSEASRVRAATVPLGSNPAVILRLNRPVLDKLLGSVTRLGSKYSGRFPIPEVKFSVGGVDIQTREFRITEFAEPIVKYDLVPQNKINGTIEFPSVVVDGPFDACRRTLVSTQKDTGNLTFSVTKVMVLFQITVGEFSNGLPKIDTFGCQSSLGPCNLKVRNATEKFAIDVFKVGAGAFRSAFDSTVCNTVNRFITNQLNRFLAKIPNVLEFNRKLALKYQVKPQVGKDYVQIGVFGKYLTEHVSPHIPSPFVESPTNDAIVVLLVSDAPLNDMAFQAYKNGILAFTISKTCHPLLYSLVQLNCDPHYQACLGNVAPSLIERFGADADVELDLRANKPPEFEFIQDKALFRASVVSNLTITPTNGTITYPEATAYTNIAGEVKVKIVNNSFYAKIDIQELSVNIDAAHNKKYEQKIADVIRHIVEEHINGGLLLRGMHIHLPFGIGCTNPTVKIAPHTYQIHSGFGHHH